MNTITVDEASQKYQDHLNKVKNANLPDPAITQSSHYRLASDKEYPFTLEASSPDVVGGLEFAEDGNSYFYTKGTSLEVVGDVYPTGIEGVPAKHIEARNGNIHLHAKNGDVIIDAKNIILRASDGNGGIITLNASKIVQTLAPEIRIVGDDVSTSASNQVSSQGAFSSIGAVLQHETAQGTDVAKSSFLGKILAVIKSLQKFMQSPCEDIGK